ITQFTNPIGTKGYLDILVNDVKKRVYITDTHLEEDTANLEHKSNYSLINYNRAGVPLLETVTDPCINSAEEALAFLENLRSMFLYLGVSQARADRGQIRCDVNVSLHKENEPFGTRVEIKNVNSFGNVYKVILGEIKRQTDILNNNGVIDQETRRYDEALDVTVAMRSKVDAIDYKYYVEPNIPKIKIEKSFIDEVKQTIPKLQYERYENYNNLNISKVDINKIIKEKVISDFFDECLALGADPIKCCNLFVTNVLFILNKENKKINELYLKPSHLVDIMNLLENNTISSKQAKELISKTNELEKEPMVLVKELNMEQVTDSSLILSIVNEVLDEQVEAIEEIKAGRDKKVNF
ncbi:MAG: Asp-tRNA(Asn)/Glu-tRNA(Gln) amidotransferase subunit GatB, partial [Mycoplasmatota bacterium]